MSIFHILSNVYWCSWKIGQGSVIIDTETYHTGSRSSHEFHRTTKLTAKIFKIFLNVKSLSAKNIESVPVCNEGMMSSNMFLIIL